MVAELGLIHGSFALKTDLANSRERPNTTTKDDVDTALPPPQSGHSAESIIQEPPLLVVLDLLEE